MYISYYKWCNHNTKKSHYSVLKRDNADDDYKDGNDDDKRFNTLLVLNQYSSVYKLHLHE